MNLTIIAGLIAGIFAGLASKVEIHFLAIIFFVVTYLVHNIRRPMGEAYITDVMKNDILATTLSTESQVTTVFAAIAAPLIGLASDKFGVGIGISAVSCLMLIFLPFYYARK
ncbi:MAG TPA: hypothetical protein PLO89_02065 [Spirochaetota bacterium]|nr:hypothetical protein [Spirochaetota bacterium]